MWHVQEITEVIATSKIMETVCSRWVLHGRSQGRMRLLQTIRITFRGPIHDWWGNTWTEHNHEDQHRIREPRSWISSLLFVWKSWKTCRKQEVPVHKTFLDIIKAFYTVPHAPLKAKVAEKCFTCSFLLRLRNYLKTGFSVSSCTLARRSQHRGLHRGSFLDLSSL